MHRYRMIIAALVGILGSPGVPGAQEVGGYGYRDGFWIGFGFGPGHAQIDCSACGSRPANDPWDGGAGYSAYLALGGTPRSNVLLGGEVALYLKETSSSERDASLGSVALVMQYYPLGDSPLFLKSGAGFGWYELVDYYYLDSFFGRTSSGLGGTGYALQTGIGYDFLLSSKLAIVPFAGVVQVLARDEPDDGSGAARGPTNPRYLNLGLALHWY